MTRGIRTAVLALIAAVAAIGAYPAAAADDTCWRMARTGRS